MISPVFSYRSHRPRFFFLMLMLCFVCGCAPRHAPALEEKNHATNPFANHIGTLGPGSYRGQNLSTPFGPSSFVRVGQEYLSGLGLICKRVTMDTSTGSHRSTACKENDGWFLADPIFEPSAL